MDPESGIGKILRDFHATIERTSTPYPQTFWKHSTKHFIETTGPTVYSKPHRLGPYKLTCPNK